jgi:endonuclease-3 related protein
VITQRLREIYTHLDAAYGDELWHWDPAHVANPMDIIVGAILVQHTTWNNAERALIALRAAGILNPDTIVAMPEERLIDLIRVSGTPTVKAKRLRALMRTIDDAGGLGAFLTLPIDELRPRLLATHGVGPETADAIALYAAGHRTFVIDAYTRRLFGRIGVMPESDGYEDWRTFFQGTLPDADVTLFQRYHAWIVLHGKAVCRPKPYCEACPLLELCAHGQRMKASLTLPAAAHPPTTARAARTVR